MFTVIIAAYNAEKYISQTLDSLRDQSFTEWECLIVENGSNDLTVKISEKYSSLDNRIRLKRLPYSNKSAALNLGIISANFEWISILDADDMWEKDKLLNQFDFIIKNDVDVLGTQLKYVDSLGKEIVGAPALPQVNKEIVEKFSMGENAIANSSAVYKKSLHQRLGYYDTEIFVEDYDWWKRCVRYGVEFSNLSNSLLLHRLHNESNFNSKSKQENMKKLIDQLDVIHRRMK